MRFVPPARRIRVHPKQPMLVVSDTVRRTRTPDGGMLLDVRRGRILCLNVIGSKILDLIEGGGDEEHIVEALKAEYDMPIDTVRADVRDFLQTLVQHEVLHASFLRATQATKVTNGNADAT